MSTHFKSILASLPYSKPFLFVDEILHLDENSCSGRYSFTGKELFYEGHFKDNPVTPGVILTECMGQIGLVCLGLFLVREASKQNAVVALASTEIDFFLPVFPGETVSVYSEKIYFRFNKLKCKVRMENSKNKIVASGIISGMLSERLKEQKK
jgi:3-hydroxyacyl-[acyl-carrier-protein] dehydratase